MSIHLHVERLILDGTSLSPNNRPVLQSAVETELTRLLGRGGLNASLQSGGAFYNAETADIQLEAEGGPERLGMQIAGAVYGGIGK
jgi:hypothetical protein